MSNRKIKTLMDAQKQVMGAWLKYLISLRKFRCFSSKRKTVVNETGAHIVGERQEMCELFNTGVECEDKTCPRKFYNVKIVREFNLIKSARHERNLAFWDVLGLKEFIENRTSYKDIKKQVRKQKDEVERLRGNVLDAYELITAVPVNHDSGVVGSKSGVRSHCLIMNPHDNWSQNFCCAFSKRQYCRRILLTAELMGGPKETPKETIDRIMKYGCIADPYQHILYAKMVSNVEVPIVGKDGVKYVDFSNVCADNHKRWVKVYESSNKQWVESGVINLPDYSGYIPIEQNILGVPELTEYKGGSVFWNAENRTFVACPICVGFMANMAYIDGKAELERAESTYNDSLAKKRTAQKLFGPSREKK